ncbi:MAG TPA: BTAD domain-containing putative transcriptional regulator [Candidatus Limnocylindria bacterium]|nr:BTAD domain-containing putative transcriptional regulator [Candidatus Limnocylindria bacterium]
MPGVRRRALLVRLLVDVNRVLSVERLIADLWEGDPPRAAAATLQSHISHVRKVVGPGKVLNRSGGYVFSLGDGRLDVIDFEADLRAGRTLVAAGRPSEALPVLQRALGHWRGPALADVAQAEWSRPEMVRLEEMRLDAVDLGLEARLAAGQTAEVVALAEAAVAEHPLRENFWAHLIAALYRQGRQADALEAFQRLRRGLVDNLGLEPSARLVELESAVLRHQPALDTPVPTPFHPGIVAIGPADAMAIETLSPPARLVASQSIDAVAVAVADADAGAGRPSPPAGPADQGGSPPEGSNGEHRSPLEGLTLEAVAAWIAASVHGSVEPDHSLSPDTTARRVLATAATIGEAFVVPFLTQVSELPEPVILDVLDWGRHAGVVYEAGPDRFEFVSPIIFRAFHDQPGPTRRAAVHRRAARLLAAGASKLGPATVEPVAHRRVGGDQTERHRTASTAMAEARHWAAGGRPDDLADILRSFRCGVQQAVDELGPIRTASWLQDMLDVIDLERGPQDPVTEPLLLAFASASRASIAEDNWDPARDASEADWVADDGTLLLDALLTSNRSLIGTAPAAPEMLAVADRAMTRLSQERPATGARRLALLANELAWTNVLEDRLLVGRHAVELARGAGPSAFVTVAALVCSAVAVPSTIAWRLDLTAESVAVAAQSGDPRLRFFAAFVRLQCVIEAGEGEETDRLLELLENLAGEQDKPLYAWAATMGRAWRQVITGDLEAAGRSIIEFRNLGTSLGRAETAVACYRLRMAMAGHAGAADGHRDDGRPWSPSLLPLERLRCFAASREVDQGNYEAGIHLLQEEAKNQFSTPPTADWLAAQLMWAEVTLRLRATGPASLLYQQLLPYASQLQTGPLTTSGGAVAEYLGALAGLLGRYHDADRHYGEATRLLRHFRAPFHLARVEVAWARLLDGHRELRRPEQARALLIDAIAIADRHGCHGVGRAARRELLEHTLRNDALTGSGR